MQPLSEAERRRRAHNAAQRQAELRRTLLGLERTPPAAEDSGGVANTAEETNASTSVPLAKGDLSSSQPQSAHSFSESLSAGSDEPTQNRLLEDMFSAAVALRAQASAAQRVVQSDNKVQCILDTL